MISIDGEEVCTNIQLGFIDWYRFMKSSLDELTASLSDNKCYNLCQLYKDEELMRWRVLNPYEYIDSWGRFKETKPPSENALYRKLSIKDISDQDYELVQQVWITTKRKTLGCYEDTYLKADFLLPAQVLKTFRDSYLKSYRLDPGHFYFMPGLAWPALIKTAFK